MFGGISRQELYASVDASTRLTRVYMALVVLSTVVAAVGLIKDNVAVIIGAMVIAPLLGPNTALALATTLGDLALSLAAGGAGTLAFATGVSAALVGVMVAVAVLILFQTKLVL